MKNVEQLLSELAVKEITLSLVDDSIRCFAPKGALTAELKARILNNKTRIIAALKEKQAVSPSQGASDAYIRIPLSIGQKGLRFIQNLNPELAAYNVPICLDLGPSVDTACFLQAWQLVLQKYPLLCAKVTEDDGEYFHSIVFAEQPHIEEVQCASIEDAVYHKANHIFDFNNDFLCNTSLLQDHNGNKSFLIIVHHIIFDGISSVHVLSALLQFYQALKNGEQVRVERTLAYSDFIDWEKQYLASDECQAAEAYWQQQITGENEPLGHLFQRHNLDAKTGASELHSFELPQQLSNQVRNFCIEHRIQPAAFFLAAYQILLNRYTGQDKIYVGMPVIMRPIEAVELDVGYYVNMLPIRSDHAQAGAFVQFLKKTQETLLNALCHSAYPFPLIAEKFVTDKPHDSAVFQTSFAYQNFIGDQESLLVDAGDATDVSFNRDIIQQSDLDISLEVFELQDAFSVKLKYHGELYCEHEIAALAGHYENLLRSGIGEPEKALERLPMLSREDTQHLVFDLNATAQDYPAQTCIHELFEQQVAKSPEAIAVECGSQQLSYRALNAQANQFAHYLVEEQGIKPGDLVGLCLERSMAMAISILGILKAGAAYVPLDPKYPQDRLTHILSDSAAKLVLVQTGTRAQVGETVTTLLVEELGQADTTHFCAHYSTDNLCTTQLGLSAQDLVYVIYTSGSTGKPKGVMLAHQNVSNYLSAVQHYPHTQDITCAVMSTSLSFDATVTTLFGAWMRGGYLKILSEEGNIFDELHDAMQSLPNAMFKVTPAHLQGLEFTAPVLGKHVVVVGGEAFSYELALKTATMMPNSYFINEYGPTEATVGCSIEVVGLSELQSMTGVAEINIGRPIMNSQLFVLDDQQTLLPKGVTGELYIGGEGLAKGYVGREDLTAERFIDNPFYDATHRDSSERLYRTGDLVRYLSNGQLEFLGRADDQVKIRGFRIELGEVEAKLATQPGVDSALVMAKEYAGSLQLVGYINAASDLADEAKAALICEVKAGLATQLPDYMVPSLFVVVAQWPLTPNGKIDRRQLDAMDVMGGITLSYQAPSTATEHQLVAIWSQLLEIDAAQISTNANFFELGGHSLLSNRLVSQIRKHFAIDLPIHMVFNVNTLADLAQAIESHSGDSTLAPVTKIAREQAHYDVSFSQQRLWFIDRLQGGTPEYNMPVAFNVKGQLDIALLNEVFRQIIARHEILRTVYVEVDGQAQQQIRTVSQLEFAIHEQDIRHLEEAAQAEYVKNTVAAEFVTPFDLARDVMLRVTYLQTADNSGVLMFNMHHIASDGWSIEVLNNEFFALYDALRQGHADPLPEMAVQYVDYAHWQHTHLAGTVLDKQLDYWVKQLDEAPAVHSLPLSFPRPQSRQYAGKTLTGRLSSQVGKQLQALAKRHQLTPFMLLHGAFALLLSRHSNSTDIVIGTPVANRTQEALTSLIGCFVNTLALRVDTEHATLVDYFAHLRQVHLDAQANQDVPFEQLVDKLNLPRNTNHSPVFQIMMTTSADFHADDQQAQAAQLTGLELTPYQTTTVQTKFDLNVDLNINEDGVALTWLYDVSLFSAQAIATLNEHLCCLMSRLCEAATEDISPEQLAMLSRDEVQHLVCELNDTAQAYEKDQCIHQLFEQQAAVNPDKIAVRFAEQQLTYKQLNDRANALAHRLVEEHGVNVETLVGLCINRSLEMVVGILGILKAGGAYVPLDPSYPKQRLEYMIEATSITTVVSHDAAMGALDDFAGEVINLDKAADDMTGITQLDRGVTPSNLAYVIFTSGSTGKPKGVMIEHRNLVNYMSTNTDNYYAEHLHGSLVFTSLSFDLTLPSIYLPLVNGGVIDLVGNEDVLDPRVKTILSTEQAKLLRVTPSHLSLLVDQFKETQVSTAHVFIVGGEVLENSLATKLYEIFPACELINHYGPSESTIGCSSYRVDNTLLAQQSVIPIGRPMGNINFFVLSKTQSMVPFGVVGELYIGGDGLARGYFNQPELTAERFIDNPYYEAGNPNSAARIYRTGDLVRYLPNGNLEFVGRADNQVKIRGFRIELGEVESKLAAQQGVESALVIAKELAGSMQLVGYFKAQQTLDDEAQAAFIAAIKAGLSQQLPDYMVPSVLVSVAQWPLTPNGKVDRRQLDAMDVQVTSTQAYQAATTETERQLVAIWSQLLGLQAQQISTSANFFELGGHSLLSIRLVSQIRQQFAVELPVQAVFDAANLAQLALTIASYNQGDVRPPLTQIARAQNHYDVSFSQQRLWFIDQLQGGTPEYNMPVAFDVQGKLDVATVNDVLRQIIARHEILRTVYVAVDGQAQQQIRAMSDIDFTVDEQDLRHLPGEAQTQYVMDTVAADSVKPFDLSCDVMLRVAYLHTADDEGVLVFNMHHIASDGWSIEVLNKEFFALYEAFSQGLPNPLPELAIQYVDYAQWQRTHLAGPVLDKQLDYWVSQLEDVPAVHSLPLSNPRPENKQYEGNVISGHLPDTVGKQLQALAKRHQLTPFMLLHGALSLLLSRHSNNTDIVIGTPVANRMQEALTPLIGCFVNTLALRVNTGQATLAEYFAHVRQTHLAAQANQDVPFEQLVDKLSLPRNSNHSPLCQIMMTTRSNFTGDERQAAELELAGLAFTPYQSQGIHAKFDLNVDLSISDAGVAIDWTYDVSLFDDAAIDRLNAHLCRLLTGLSELSSVDVAPHSLPMLSEAEEHHLVTELNMRTVTYAKDKCIHEVFALQAQQHPDSVAVVFENQQLTYKALNERANQLAHYLIAMQGVKPDTLVGLCVAPSLEMMVGILGILKAGGAYVPIDPKYPQSRIDYILEDAELTTIVSHSQVNAVFSEFSGQVVNLDEVACYQTYSTENIPSTTLGLTSSHLAYVIYTSGSTGKPKGVLTPHLGVIRLVKEQGFMVLNNDTCMMQCANIAFDAATLEIWGPLLNSGRVVLYGAEQLMPALLNEEIKRHGVNTLWLTAGFFREWSNHIPDDLPLQQLLAGGDVLDLEAIKRVQNQLPNCQLINGYGPTENTTFSTTYQFKPAHDGLVPIGTRLPSDDIYILDNHGHLIAKGGIGELYVGGDGLARGYLNRPELTAERFIDNPYYAASHGHGSEKLYRTGDLVRYLADGNLEFIGRADDQVKIRGFRIELGEVESQLGAQAGVDSALVMAKEFAGAKQLIGYVKPTEALDEQGQIGLITRVKAALSTELPEYMVPSVLMVVDTWPLNANGKVDRKALPEPDGSAMQCEYIAPHGEIEAGLVQIWAELLTIDAAKISASANFFELGGHSLLSIRLVSQIRTQFEVELPVQAVFSAMSLSDLARAIEAHSHSVLMAPITATERAQTHLDVSFAQQRLWFIDQLQGGTPEYNIPVAFHVEGELNVPLVNEVFSLIIARHEILRTVYVEVDGTAQQRIRAMSEVDFSTTEIGLQHLSKEAQASTVKSLVEADFVKPFDLQNDVMLRVTYLRTEVEAGVLVFNMHHIASDGWSMEVLGKEFFSLYDALSQGQLDPLPELDIQYADFAHWQRTHLAGVALDKQLDYWVKQLDDAPAVHSLPLCYPRPDVDHAGQSQRFGKQLVSNLSAEVGQQLHALAKQHQLTPFMMLHGAVSLLLARHSNSADIVIGTPIANRMREELAPLLGCFVNTLVLRVDTAQETLADYFAHLREVHLEAQANQDVPFEQLVDKLNVPRSTCHSPLFQIMMTTKSDFGVNHEDTSTIQLDELILTPYESDKVQAKFDINIDLNISELGVEITWTYDAGLFSEQAIRKLDENLARLMTGLSKVSEAQVAPHSLPVLSEHDRQHLLFELNDTEQAYPFNQCVHELFEQQVAASPDAIALEFGTHTLSYQQLNEQANQLAHYLIETQKVKPGALVGLCLARSLEMVVAILGILKAGGAYVPLDPQYPQERLAHILTDSGVEVVLVQSDTCAVIQNCLRSEPLRLLQVDGLGYLGAAHLCANYQSDNLDREQLGLSAQDLAYVIYTSGSTGKPKGVMLEHHTVSNYLTEVQQYPHQGIRCTVMSTSLSFDATVTPLFGAWMRGGYLKVLPENSNIFDELHVAIQTLPSAMFKLTPAHLQGLSLEEPVFSEHVFVVGGEAFTQDLALKMATLMPNSRFINEYGPTEATVGSSVEIFSLKDLTNTQGGTDISIGRPILNTQLLVLDAHQQLLPKGVAGELYIGGAGLARGYVNRADLTAERFIRNPYFDEDKANSSERLYRTGDLVRYLADGKLEFIGRADDQVKVRGFRIELGEVEARLSAQQGVDSAIVMAKELAGSLQLVGYIQADSALSDTARVEWAEQVKTALAAQLPDYMVPRALIAVSSWPLTPNGKVDRKALPEPHAHVLQNEYVAPRNETEQDLAAMWAQLLGRQQDSIGIHDDFFELGGHSLLAVQLLSKLRNRYAQTLPVSVIFTASTIAQLADYLTTANDASESALVALQSQGDKEVIFAIPGGGGNILPLNNLSREFGQDQPFYALQSIALDGPQPSSSRRLQSTT
ncbi:hypothetical protein A7985_22810 [Pseudoalteromonas luteoviolacea]|uniref:Carrier domain-containing protein n=1 Tax=Pseudoalteromonas luteoviolacea TaxID=43657 RepID=A0A1C0TKF9_9GAMM|nr:non-ribosomal peptide synthetase [Pseudoalteromonas luteoviolacea]OCQ18849.1 hypothetical protein A7985_22810 [Pseudoalteromonas luteoviolacea]